MTAQTVTAFLQELEQSAHAASTVEEDYRREVTERFRILAEDRAFGFRRLALMNSVTGAVCDCEEEDEAIKRGVSAFLVEIGWTGVSESHQEICKHFEPVVQACWEATRSEEPDGGYTAITKELNAFESWFAGSRTGAFMSELEREVVELPLVEVI